MLNTRHGGVPGTIHRVEKRPPSEILYIYTKLNFARPEHLDFRAWLIEKRFSKGIRGVPDSSDSAKQFNRLEKVISKRNSWCARNITCVIRLKSDPQTEYMVFLKRNKRDTISDSAKCDSQAKYKVTTKVTLCA